MTSDGVTRTSGKCCVLLPAFCLPPSAFCLLSPAFSVPSEVPFPLSAFRVLLSIDFDLPSVLPAPPTVDFSQRSVDFAASSAVREAPSLDFSKPRMNFVVLSVDFSSPSGVRGKPRLAKTCRNPRKWAIRGSSRTVREGSVFDPLFRTVLEPLLTRGLMPRSGTRAIQRRSSPTVRDGPVSTTCGSAWVNESDSSWLGMGASIRGSSRPLGRASAFSLHELKERMRLVGPGTTSFENNLSAQSRALLRRLRRTAHEGTRAPHNQLSNLANIHATAGSVRLHFQRVNSKYLGRGPQKTFQESVQRLANIVCSGCFRPNSFAQ